MPPIRPGPRWKYIRTPRRGEVCSLHLSFRALPELRRRRERNPDNFSCDNAATGNSFETSFCYEHETPRRPSRHHPAYAIDAVVRQNAAFITDPAQIKSKDKFDVQQLSVDKLFTTRNIGASTWSPDGKQIAFVSNISGRSNIWLVSSESGWPTQLTVSDQRQISPAWSPNGRWIAYGSDVDGNEQWDIFIVSPATGQVINLTNTPDISEENFLWSPDSERLAYSVKPKESPNYEIDIMEVATKKVTHLTSNTPADLNNSPAAWSRDGKWLVFNQSNAAGKNADIFLADTATGKSSNLTAHTGDKVYTATDISPDGKTILLTCNAGNGFDNAALLDVASKKVSPLTEDKWEINTGQFSPDGKLLTWVKNADGNSEIVTYDLAKREQRALPLPNGINTLAGSDTAFSGKGPRDLRLLLNHNGPNAPNDIWVYDLTTGKTHQVTHSLSAGVRGEDMVAPFLVHYPRRTASGRSRPSSMFPIMPSATARTLPSCPSMAGQMHRSSTASIAIYSSW